MNNREWLLNMGGEERQAWFDAQHVDGVEIQGELDEIETDSREKLEADIHRAADEMEKFTYGEKFINTNKILRWLDRQAAIAHHEAFMRGRASLDDEFAEYADEIAELTAERDALADDLLTCNKEREQYRELFSQAITLAAEIVNLQP